MTLNKGTPTFRSGSKGFPWRHGPRCGWEGRGSALDPAALPAAGSRGSRPGPRPFAAAAVAQRSDALERNSLLAEQGVPISRVQRADASKNSGISWKSCYFSLA
eukprot:5980900-Prymnesium_polylepis.1